VIGCADLSGHEAPENDLRALLGRFVDGEERLLFALARRSAPGWVDTLFRRVTHAGGATSTTLFSLLLLTFPPTRSLGGSTLLANFLSHLVVQALKRTVTRPRPSAALNPVSALAQLPDQFSFPSGHACAAMAVAVPVLLQMPAAGLPLLVLALLVGASRVYLRVHYLTDVVVGQLLGAAIGVLAVHSLS